MVNDHSLKYIKNIIYDKFLIAFCHFYDIVESLTIILDDNFDTIYDIILNGIFNIRPMTSSSMT